MSDIKRAFMAFLPVFLILLLAFLPSPKEGVDWFEVAFAAILGYNGEIVYKKLKKNDENDAE